jgi:hypothetical protein
MFADDVGLIAETVAAHGALPQLVVEAGGLEYPCLADYRRTIDALKRGVDIVKAQELRYINAHRPLEEWAPGYRCEDPGTGGCSIAQLSEAYGYNSVGTVICLSTLEHVEQPFEAVMQIRDVLRVGGLAIVSVPFQFPYHPSPSDHWRFTPSGLRIIFCRPCWEILSCDWRLNIPASAGILDIHTGQPQAVQSCAIVARAV